MGFYNQNAEFRSTPNSTTCGIQEALYDINSAGGGKLIISGANSPTYLLSSKTLVPNGTTNQYACLIVYSNTEIVVERNATLKQANSIGANFVIANEYMQSGYGSNTNIKIIVDGWVDANYANQGLDPGGSYFFCAGVVMYNCDHCYFSVRAKNVGRFGALVGQFSDSVIPLVWCEGITDSGLNAAALYMTDNLSINNKVGLVYSNSIQSVYLENEPSQIQIETVINNGGRIAVEINAAHDIQIGKILAIGSSFAAFVIGDTNPVAPQDQRIQINEILAYECGQAGVDFDVSVSAEYPLYCTIDNLTVYNVGYGTSNTAAGIILGSYMSKVTIGKAVIYDDQPTHTQHYFLLNNSSTTSDSILIMGGYTSGNSVRAIYDTTIFTNSRIENIVGINPVGYLSSQPALATTSVTNSNPFKCEVVITVGATATTITKNATSLGSFTSQTITLDLDVGESITLSQTTGVSWKWFGF